MITASDIRAAREKAGESQATFAKRFPVDQSTIARWEQKSPEGVAASLAERVLREAKLFPLKEGLDAVENASDVAA